MDIRILWHYFRTMSNLIFYWIDQKYCNQKEYFGLGFH